MKSDKGVHRVGFWRMKERPLLNATIQMASWAERKDSAQWRLSVLIKLVIDVHAIVCWVLCDGLASRRYQHEKI